MTQMLAVRGGRSLRGSMNISGAKNAALPLLVCGILATEPLVLENVPRLSDVANLLSALEVCGCSAAWSDSAANTVSVHAQQLQSHSVPDRLATSMRASFLLVGALLTSRGWVDIALPGGDDIGARPVDEHVKGFRLMGASVDTSQSRIALRAPRAGLRAAKIDLGFPSVGATENLMIAASLAKGETVITNAAREPEVVDLADCLKQMGVPISGEGSSTIHIEGVANLRPAVHRVIPDRIELGTYACAAAMTEGVLDFPGVQLSSLGGFAEVAGLAGVHLEQRGNILRAQASAGGLRAVNAATAPFPGLATDMQPQLVTMLTGAQGTSHVTEAVFEKRFRYVEELRRLGARIALDDREAIVWGGTRLGGGRVVATDVRAAAALVLAGLVSDGEVLIDGVDHLLRGHEHLADKLLACGADVEWRSEAALRARARALPPV